MTPEWKRKLHRVSEEEQQVVNEIFSSCSAPNSEQAGEWLARLDLHRARRYVRMADGFRKLEMVTELFLSLIACGIAALGIFCGGLAAIVGVFVALWMLKEALFTDTSARRGQRLYRRQLRRSRLNYDRAREALRKRDV